MSLVLTGETDKWKYPPFRITLPLADQIRRTHTEEGTLCFCRDGFGEERLSGSWWTV